MTTKAKTRETGGKDGSQGLGLNCGSAEAYLSPKARTRDEFLEKG